MGLIICLFALESQFTNRFLDSREFLTLQLTLELRETFSIFLIKKERKKNMGIEKVEIIV